MYAWLMVLVFLMSGLVAIGWDYCSQNMDCFEKWSGGWWLYACHRAFLALSTVAVVTPIVAVSTYAIVNEIEAVPYDVVMSLVVALFALISARLGHLEVTKDFGPISWLSKWCDNRRAERARHAA